ncbi:MAG: hypothetical protein IPJ71_03320 [Bdellovibrionales bacterium]|nr:hypothetical protein [Bdellovibrionales bacterium]
MMGAKDARFGKMPLTSQSALTGQLGLQVLPIPSRVAIDRINPRYPAHKFNRLGDTPKFEKSRRSTASLIVELYFIVSTGALAFSHEGHSFSQQLKSCPALY